MPLCTGPAGHRGFNRMNRPLVTRPLCVRFIRPTIRPTSFSWAWEIFFLVEGANKAERIAEIMEGASYPATVVTEGPSQVTWLVDEAAARLLSR
jgi:hypothetical protein